MIRDPLTMETVIPFGTRPTKTDETKNLAWETIHQEAQGHFQGRNLKLTDISQSTLIQDEIMHNNTNEQYNIAQDKDYIKINFNESSKKLYDYIKDKAVSTFHQFKHTRHAVVQNTKLSNYGKT